MLLTLMLSLLQSLAIPPGLWSPGSPESDLPQRCCLVGTPSSSEEPPTKNQAQLTELRKTLFRTGRPALLSHDLPAVPLEPPAPVSAPGVSNVALRQLNVQPTGFTPYDRYLGMVRNVMAELPPRRKSLAATCRLLRAAHNFRYSPGDPYRADSPAVTAARRAGDCKAKALWLYDQLGDPGVLYVIGKVSRTSRNSHAWLYWRWEERWWILDPTNQNAPIASDSVGSGRYVPYYSFTHDATYRHPATYLLFAKADTKTPSTVASQSASLSRGQ